MDKNKDHDQYINQNKNGSDKDKYTSNASVSKFIDLEYAMNALSYASRNGTFSKDKIKTREEKTRQA